MKITVLSCSLDPQSRSRWLANRAVQLLTDEGHDTTLIDLRDQPPLPAFDNDRAFEHPLYRTTHDAIATADGIIIAAPVYNWGLGGMVKNVIELTGATGVGDRRSAWFDKLVTFICAGGLPHSYMAFGATALSLMLDFKCIVNPYIVYATARDWLPNGEPGEAMDARLKLALAVKVELAQGLAARSYRSTWDV